MDQISSYLSPRRIVVIRTIIWLIPLGLLSWIVNRNLAIFGSLALRCTPERCDQRINNFASREPEILVGTLRGTKEQHRVITQFPLVFDVKLFRSMNRASVTLTYQNPENEEHLRLGILTKGSKYEYYDFADHDSKIVFLENNWNAVREDGLTLFQKPDSSVKQYSSIEEFFDNHPDPLRIVTYNIDPKSPMRIASYVPATTTRRYENSIRGSHTMLVYLGKNEPLDIRFSIQDINRHRGKDDVTIRVLRGADEVSTTVLRDDGDTTASGRASTEREVHLSIPDLTPGTYRIEIQTKDDDPFVRAITSKQKYFMFERNLYLAGNQEYKALGSTVDDPITIFFIGKELTVRTSHESALQTISVGTKRVALTKVNKQTKITLPDTKELTPITIPIRDVELISEGGVFVFTPENYFSIQQFAKDSLTQITDLSTHDYVFARYQQVRQNGKWAEALQTIERLPKGHTIHFLIEGTVPGEHPKNPLRIKQLQIRLEGDSLTPRKIINLIRSLVPRLKNQTI